MTSIKRIERTILLLFSLCCIYTSYGQNFNIILGRPTDTSITASIMFNDQPADVYLEYGTQSGSYTATTSTYVGYINTPLEIFLTGLNSNTKYYYRARYRVHSSSSTFSAGAEHTFYTQRTTGTTFTFDVEADEHLYDYGNTALYGITLRNEANDNPDFIISLGDIFGDDHYPWTITSHMCDSLHYLYRDRLGSVCHSIPFYVCLGNHEGEKKYYLDTQPPNNIAVWSTLWRKYYYPNPEPNTFYSGDTIQEQYGVGHAQNYYAWTWGNALFVVLDAYRYDCYYANADTTAKPTNWNWTLGKTQYDWLKSTLENSKAKFKFVFAHHVSGESRGGVVPAQYFEWGGYDRNGVYRFDTYRPGWGKPIHQLFVDNGVNIFFQGHDHLFAHETLNGITYQEVPMAADATYTKGMIANGAAYLSDTIDASGHVRVTVNPSYVKVDYVRAFLPQDTISGANHNGQISFTYTISDGQTTGVSEIKANSYCASVNPNPAKNQTVVTFNQLIDKAIEVRLLTVDGRCLQQWNYDNALDRKIALDLTNVPRGLYIISIMVDNINLNTNKLVVY